MDERELSLAVVGIGYDNDRKSKGDRRFEMMLCAPGDPIELRREPKNKHDKHAVAVFTERGTQLGYLTAERAPWIGGKILAGEEYVAIYQQPGVMAAVIRVRFGGGAPTLPSPRPVRQSSDESGHVGEEFYPDPEPDEWGA
ncbi:HIRAN domain-containing protein [Sphingomonas sp. UYP23]